MKLLSVTVFLTEAPDAVILNTGKVLFVCLLAFGCVGCSLLFGLSL